ncbi:MAG: rhodanese-like domain-containing protein [Alcanivoracaceae bacterium]|nr:rhodanese-like domain-containing protein [Alcanivoracaceae bacterium]
MTNTLSSFQMKMLFKYIVIFTLFHTLFSCSKFGPEQQLAWEKLDKGALLIDVRTKQEFKDGHLTKAINIEYENIPLLIKAIGMDKSRSVVFYCRSGRRASVAINELKKLGYDNIYNAQALSAMEAALENKRQVEK